MKNKFLMLTKENFKPLISGMQISIWEKESFYRSQDIIIIGAGLAGLWSAYNLIKKDPKLRILILEKGIIPYGASTRNAGFACFGSLTELISDAAIMGSEKMWQIVEMRYKGIQKIRSIFPDNEIDYDACGGFECLDSKVHNIEQLKNNLPEWNKNLQSITGIKETFSFNNNKLSSFGLHGFDALIENKLEGGLHSGKLVQALLKKLQSMGVEVLTGISVQRWQDKGHEVEIFTNHEVSFKSSQLIICTNAFSNALIENAGVIPARGQVIVTSPIENLQLRGTFHYDEGYYYFRNLGNRVLLGGARNKAMQEEATTELNTTDLIQKELEQFLSDHILRQSYKIEYRWSGIMGFTPSKEPVIKQVAPRVCVVLLCNGMGVSLAPTVTEHIPVFSIINH